ncbi:hypothetical protein KC360_g2326 [Hortaea werneckii]|nr:hypothetical protein KC325_g2644 [Hortaea werneckii]KAI7000477.1 hypothetical protein KC359_g1150 [Hortaea werneckii]KAI7147867.1 hypothetical protein KC344_g2363 [Hortaea werneckii]KAI7177434.1 hypothetical protein KC360_g2326 [Hortaea werneckii]
MSATDAAGPGTDETQRGDNGRPGMEIKAGDKGKRKADPSVNEHDEEEEEQGDVDFDNDGDDDAGGSNKRFKTEHSQEPAPKSTTSTTAGDSTTLPTDKTDAARFKKQRRDLSDRIYHNMIGMGGNKEPKPSKAASVCAENSDLLRVIDAQMMVARLGKGTEAPIWHPLMKTKLGLSAHVNEAKSTVTKGLRDDPNRYYQQLMAIHAAAQPVENVDKEKEQDVPPEETVAKLRGELRVYKKALDNAKEEKREVQEEAKSQLAAANQKIAALEQRNKVFEAFAKDHKETYKAWSDGRRDKRKQLDDLAAEAKRQVAEHQRRLDEVLAEVAREEEDPVLNLDGASN